VRVVVHDLGEAERRCGCCGAAYERSPTARSLGGWWSIGSSIAAGATVAVVTARGFPSLKVAPVPAKVIPTGLFSPLAIASVLVEKCALARPVNMIVASLSMHGLEVSPGSLAGVLAKVNVLLGPLGGGASRAGPLRFSCGTACQPPV